MTSSSSLKENSNRAFTGELSDELLAIAREELNEKAEWVERDIAALLDMITSNKNLHGRTEPEFLLRFLRARKFDYDRALRLYTTYYHVRLQHADLFGTFLPSSVQRVLIDGCVGLLPQRNQLGQRVLVFRPGIWQPDQYHSSLLLKACLIVVEHLLQHEDVQVCGLSVLVDLAEFGWKQANQCGVQFARRTSKFLQGSMPCRVRNIHFVNEPVVFGYAFQFLKPFLKEKLQKRLNFHGSSYSKLHEVFPKSIIPKNLPMGGNGGEYPDFHWINEIIREEPKFESWLGYYMTNESGDSESMTGSDNENKMNSCSSSINSTQFEHKCKTSSQQQQPSHSTGPLICNQSQSDDVDTE